MEKDQERILQTLTGFIHAPTQETTDSPKCTESIPKPDTGLPHDLQNIQLLGFENAGEPKPLITNTTELDSFLQDGFNTDLPQTQMFSHNTCAVTGNLNEIVSPTAGQVSAPEESPQPSQIQSEESSCNVVESITDSSTIQAPVQLEHSPVPLDITNKLDVSGNIQQTKQTLLTQDQCIIDEIMGRQSVQNSSQNIFVCTNNVNVLNSQPLTSQQFTVNNTPSVSMRMDISENIISENIYSGTASVHYSTSPASSLAVSQQDISTVRSDNLSRCASEEHQQSTIISLPDLGSPSFRVETTQAVFLDNSQKVEHACGQTTNTLISPPPACSLTFLDAKSSTHTSNSHFFGTPIQSSNIGIQNVQQVQPSNQNIFSAIPPSLEGFNLQFANSVGSMPTSTTQTTSLTCQNNMNAFENKLSPLKIMTSLSTGSSSTNTVQNVNSLMPTIICTPTSSQTLLTTNNSQQSSLPNNDSPSSCTANSCIPENPTINLSAPLQNVMVVSAIDHNTNSVSQLSGINSFAGQKNEFLPQINSSNSNSGLNFSNAIPLKTISVGDKILLAPVTPINKSVAPTGPLVLGTPLPTLITAVSSQNTCPKSEFKFVQLLSNAQNSTPNVEQQMTSANTFNSDTNIISRIMEPHRAFSFGSSSPMATIQSSAALASGTNFSDNPEMNEKITTTLANTLGTTADQSLMSGVPSEKESLLRQCLEGRMPDFDTSTPNTHLSVSQASSPDNQLTLSSPDTTDIPSPLSSPKVSLEHTTQHSLLDISKRLHLNSETVNDEDPTEISTYYPEEGDFEERVKVQKMKQNSDASSTKFTQDINFKKLLEEDSEAKGFFLFGVDLVEENRKSAAAAQPKNNTETDSPSQVCSPPIAPTPESDQASAFENAKEINLVCRAAKEYRLTTQFASKIHGYELEIKSQPEEQHRARYLTEGSRGAVKDRSGSGHPVIKLNGCRKPAKLQVFIGSDTGRVRPHGFYQACKISGKNATPAEEVEIEGTKVIEMNILPVNDMMTSIDNVGILKLRNADVERHIGVSKAKKKSTKARMVFRVTFERENGSFQTLQICSTSILCTQPVGQPEICRMSSNKCSVTSNEELFIIGRHFMRGTKVFFQEVSSENGNLIWEKEADVDTEHFHQTHLICSIPEYRDKNIVQPVVVHVVLNSCGKLSEPRQFSYTPVIQVKQEIAMETDDYHPKTLPENVSVSPVALELTKLVQESQQSSQNIFQLPPGTVPSLTATPTVGPTPMDQTQPQFDVRLPYSSVLQPQTEQPPTSSASTVACTNQVQPIFLMSNGMNITQPSFKLIQVPVNSRGMDVQPSQIVLNVVPGNAQNPNIGFLQQGDNNHQHQGSKPQS